MTAKVSEQFHEFGRFSHTVMTVELSSDHEFVQWEFGFDRINDLEDESSAVFQTPTVL